VCIIGKQTLMLSCVTKLTMTAFCFILHVWFSLLKLAVLYLR